MPYGFFKKLYYIIEVVAATPWCNGSTTGFGPVSLSSSLGGVAIFLSSAQNRSANNYTERV